LLRPLAFLIFYFRYFASASVFDRTWSLA
jgi:hypothetical protein